MLSEPLLVVASLVRVFDDLAIRYVVGGSLASFASAEDTLLHKLVWYKLGNQVADRQWSDVVGVVKVQAASLDRAYLEFWASSLGVSDLLGRALQQELNA
jgi:hypothetical protein